MDYGICHMPLFNFLLFATSCVIFGLFEIVCGIIGWWLFCFVMCASVVSIVSQLLTNCGAFEMVLSG